MTDECDEMPVLIDEASLKFVPTESLLTELESRFDSFVALWYVDSEDGACLNSSYGGNYWTIIGMLRSHEHTMLYQDAVSKEDGTAFGGA
jgi:hypothetical protein